MAQGQISDLGVKMALMGMADGTDSFTHPREPPVWAAFDGEYVKLVSVQIKRQQIPGKKVIGRKVFEVRLPEGATVALMRFMLGFNLPPTAQVLWDSDGDVVLNDHDVLPETVVVTEFKGTLPIYTFISRVQYCTLMLVLKEFLKKPETQSQLDEYEKQADGNRIVFGGLIGRLYKKNVFPVLMRRFDMPENAMDPDYMPVVCNHYLGATLESAVLWLEVETLARTGGTRTAWSLIENYARHLGMGMFCTYEQYDGIMRVNLSEDRVQLLHEALLPVYLEEF